MVRSHFLSFLLSTNISTTITTVFGITQNDLVPFIGCYPTLQSTIKDNGKKFMRGQASDDNLNYQ